MFPEEAQQAVWAEGPDVAIAASVLPVTQVTREDGGYRVSGQHSAFASGVGHSSWVIVGGFVSDGVTPYWAFFLIPPGEYKVRDTWFTAGMRATGSNTIITDNVFVPSTRVLSLSDLRDGKAPGGAVNESPIFRTPFFFYAPLTFATPMLGAAQGAYEHFREWTKTRKAVDGASVAEKTSIQVRMARGPLLISMLVSCCCDEQRSANKPLQGLCWVVRRCPCGLPWLIEQDTFPAPISEPYRFPSSCK
jgi:3-hydroxy-9,10-secoandrosta-1,3,5(10)-triene-9,17-dione monooxygenase